MEEKKANSSGADTSADQQDPSEVNTSADQQASSEVNTSVDQQDPSGVNTSAGQQDPSEVNTSADQQASSETDISMDQKASSEMGTSTGNLPDEEDLIRAASEGMAEEETSVSMRLSPEQMRSYEEEEENPEESRFLPADQTGKLTDHPSDKGGQGPVNPDETGRSKRGPRWHLRWIIPLLLILLLVICGLIWTRNRKTKISDVFDVRFEGYDSQGVLSYDADKVNEKTIRLVGKKVGLKKNQIEDMINRNTDDLESEPKYQQAIKYLEGTNIVFDRENDLKNGDVVTLRITSDYESSPIADETKTYTVSGLTQMQDMTAEQILAQYPVRFTGYNGYGCLDYDQSIYTVEKVYDHLSNGDQVELPLSNHFLESARKNGKKLAKENVSLTVSGLKEIKDISGISEVTARIDDLAKSANQDQDGDYHKISYSIKRQKSFIYYRNGQINIMNIYQLVKKESSKDITSDQWTDVEKTTFCIYGYSNLSIQNDAISTSDLEDHAGSLFSTEYVDLASAKADLAAKNYREFSP